MLNVATSRASRRPSAFIRRIRFLPTLIRRRALIEFHSFFRLGSFSAVDWREAFLISLLCGWYFWSPFPALAAMLVFRIACAVRGLGLLVLMTLSCAWGLGAAWVVEYAYPAGLFSSEVTRALAAVTAGLIIGGGHFVNRYRLFGISAPLVEEYFDPRTMQGPGGLHFGTEQSRFNADERRFDYSNRIDFETAPPPRPSAPKFDPYAALGLPRNAGEAEVKRTYRTLMKLNHPDRLKQLNPEEAARAHQQCVELSKAYKMITGGRA